MDDESLYALAAEAGRVLAQLGLTLALAESCTGGWVAKAVTDVPGSSRWFERGFVTYSNEAKQQQLGVDPELIARHGAVSEATVSAMARGAIEHSRAQCSVAVSGVAGPDGGTPDKPVGLVWFAWGLPDGVVVTASERFEGDREAVRRQAVVFALHGLITRLIGSALPV